MRKIELHPGLVRIHPDSQQMSYEEYDYAEDLAEAYESGGSRSSGGSRTKAKKKARPTTVGTKHEGGRAWGTTQKMCPKSCAKKCCAAKAVAKN